MDNAGKPEEVILMAATSRRTSNTEQLNLIVNLAVLEVDLYRVSILHHMVCGEKNPVGTDDNGGANAAHSLGGR